MEGEGQEGREQSETEGKAERVGEKEGEERGGREGRGKQEDKLGETRRPVTWETEEGPLHSPPE